MAQVNPKMPPASDTNFSSVAWQRFFHDLFARVTLASMIAWVQVNKAGSNLTDFVTRNHNDLQSIQGGSATEEYHLTAADYAGLGTGLVVRQSTVSLLVSVPSATATDIFGAAGATISINNSTPVTTTSFAACTSAQVGSVKRVIPVQDWSVIASANLVVDGATSGTFVMPAGARLEVLASTTTLFQLTTIFSMGKIGETVTINNQTATTGSATATGAGTALGSLSTTTLYILQTSSTNPITIAVPAGKWLIRYSVVVSQSSKVSQATGITLQQFHLTSNATAANVPNSGQGKYSSRVLVGDSTYGLDLTCAGSVTSNSSSATNWYIATLVQGTVTNYSVTNCCIEAIRIE